MSASPPSLPSARSLLRPHRKTNSRCVFRVLGGGGRVRRESQHYRQEIHLGAGVGEPSLGGALPSPSPKSPLGVEWRAGRQVGSKDLIPCAGLSPEYVLGAPTWSWTLGAVSAPWPATGHPEAPDPIPQPDHPHPPNLLPFFTRCGRVSGGTRTMRSCALSAQVEVLHSSYRRLHLLRGEQVRAASLPGWPRLGD